MSERLQERAQAEQAMGDDSPGALARTIRAARKHQGHTLRAVEAGTGIPNAHVSQIETGKILKPHAETLLALAEFLNLNAGLLAEWSGQPRLAALLVEREGLLKERDQARLDYEHGQRLLEVERFDKVTAERERESLAARLTQAEKALRENVGDAYNLLTQGESPTQRRGPSAQHIYDRSREALAAADPAPTSGRTNIIDDPDPIPATSIKKEVGNESQVPTSDQC